MGSYSSSQSSNPVADNKPTLSDSPTDIFNNQVKTFTGSRVAESVYGDSASQNLTKSSSMYGPSLTGSSQTYTLSGGSSITDGGATMAMFNLASEVVKQNSLSGLLQTMQGGGLNTATSAANTVAAANGDVIAKIKEFLSQHKGAVIAGGLLLGFLIYKGFAK